MNPARASSNNPDGSPPTRTVLVTGASSGIGRMTAELMARRGWQVAATARDPSTLSEWAAAAYPVRGRLALLLVAPLPDALWRSLMAAGMTRRPKRARR